MMIFVSNDFLIITQIYAEILKKIIKGQKQSYKFFSNLGIKNHKCYARFTRSLLKLLKNSKLTEI